MIKAKLFVLGTERELLWTDLEYYKILNHKTGRSGPTPMGGLVTFSFMSGYDDDRLLRWITHSEKDEFCTLTACRIVFYEEDFDGVILFEYKYNDTALVYWKETFNAVGEQPMTVTVTISAAIQEIKGKTWVKPWQESWVSSSEQMQYQAVENEVEIISNIEKCYYTDSNGKKIPKISNQKQVTLNILSKNMLKKVVNLDLSDSNHNFLFEGRELKNDILENYSIRSNKDSVQLDVIFNPVENTI